MKYGIPFIRPFTSPFGAPFFGIGSTGPQEPTGFVAKYTAYLVDNFTLVTGDSVNVWQDESVNSNDLTQSTSGNQPVLVEDNTLTQFTASNQPTFSKDKQVSQDTLAKMPTWDEAEGALDFTNAKRMEDFPFPTTGDFTLEFDLKSDVFSTTNFFVLDNGGNDYISVATTKLNIYMTATGQGLTQFNFGFTASDGDNNLKITRSGDDVSVYWNNTQVDTTKTIAGTYFDFTYLGSLRTTQDGFMKKVRLWNEVVGDIVNPVETPSFVLDGIDPTTMLNDSDVQPVNGDSVRLWHDPSAVDVMAFDSANNKYLAGLPEYTDSWTYEIDFESFTTTNSRRVLTYSYNNANWGFYLAPSGTGGENMQLTVDALDTTRNALGAIPTVKDGGKLVLRKDGNFISATANGVTTTPVDVTGLSYPFSRIGQAGLSLEMNIKSVRAWNVAVADPVNPTETPTQTITADPTEMRTSANVNPVLGDDVAKWYADEFSAYRDARVVFDATNDNMSGLPALTGDWSYMIDTSINTLGSTKYLLEQTAGSSAILALADNYMYLRDTTGANDIALTSYTLTTGRTQFGFVRSGDDLLYYVNGALKETVDVTGRTFDFGTVGKSATSADMDTKQIIPFNRALTQTEIDYYSYLRSETGEILLPPLLPSTPTIYPLSTLNIAGAGSVYTSNSSFSMANLKANGFSWMFYVDFSDPGTQVRLGGIRGDSDASTPSDFTILKLAGGDIIHVEAYNGSTYVSLVQSTTPVSQSGLTHVAVVYTGTNGTNSITMYIDGQSEDASVASFFSVGEGGRISHGGADFGGGSFTEAPTGTFGTPFLFDRAITQAEILSISSGGTSLCYDEVDNTAGLKDAIIYAPTLGEYNGSSGQALIDPASGITTNESGTVTYDGTGVSVECST